MKKFTCLNQHKILTLTIFGLSIFCVGMLLFSLASTQKNGNLKWADWTGFGEDKVVKIERKPNKEITKIIEESVSQKTLWDWLNALIIPSSIAIGGYLFQLQQKNQADANLREQALQTYLDAISAILLDEKWNALENGSSTKAAGLDIIKARTLSLFRMFREDKVRLASVIYFLSDTKLSNEMELDLADNMRNLNLPNFNLNGIDLSNTVLSGSIFSYTDLVGANLQRVKLIKSQLNNANLREAVLKEADLRGANLKQTCFERADLRTAIFGSLDDSPANLQEANLREAHLGGADLKRTDLRKAKLRYANLCGADLRGAKLQGAELTKCLYSEKVNPTVFPKDFEIQKEMKTYLIDPDADLSRRDLQDLLLMDANLQRANLQEAKLQRADLRDANLEEADLQDADLEEANLQGANLQGANLQGAQNLTVEQVQAAKNWELAYYDPEFSKQLGLSNMVGSVK